VREKTIKSHEKPVATASASGQQSGLEAPLGKYILLLDQRGKHGSESLGFMDLILLVFLLISVGFGWCPGSITNQEQG